jgi:hypothetical protein
MTKYEPLKETRVTTGGGENMNLRHIKEKIEDKMLDPDFTSKVSLAVSIVSLVVAVLVLYVKLKYRTV